MTNWSPTRNLLCVVILLAAASSATETPCWRATLRSVSPEAIW
jgi:hypothetical protein